MWSLLPNNSGLASRRMPEVELQCPSRKNGKITDQFSRKFGIERKKGSGSGGKFKIRISRSNTATNLLKKESGEMIWITVI